MATADWPTGRHSRRLFVYWRTVDFLAEFGMRLAALLVLVDLTLIGVGVVMRYVVGWPIVWSDEIVALSLTAIVMLSAPKVLLRGEHIAVDIVTGRLKGTGRALADAWSGLAVLAVSALLVANGWQTAMLARTIRLVTEGQLELPLWIFQLLLPFGGVFLALAGIARLWLAVETWRNNDDEEAGS